MKVTKEIELCSGSDSENKIDKIKFKVRRILLF